MPRRRIHEEDAFNMAVDPALFKLSEDAIPKFDGRDKAYTVGERYSRKRRNISLDAIADVIVDQKIISRHGGVMA